MRRLLLIGVVALLCLVALTKTNSASASPGISVTITTIDPFIVNYNPSGLGDTATYIVNVESITTEVENTRLTLSGDPTISFNWTTQEFELAMGSTQSFGLQASATASSTPGIYPFTVLGEAWPLGFTYDDANTWGLVELSSFQANVEIPPTFLVVPELPLGTITAMSAFLVTTGLYIIRRKHLIKTSAD